MEKLELIQRGDNTSVVDERDSSVLEESKGKISNGRRNPPARNTSRFWFERFLAVIQRQNPAVIDSSFLSQIAPNNEGKLLAQLKFLRLIDEEGKGTALLSMLNMVGEEQRKGFQKMIRESYAELMSEVMIEKAVPDDAINFFIRRYTFTRDKAINATKFFLYLAEKGSLPVSPELSSLLTEKSSNGSSQISPSIAAISPSLPRLATEKMPRTGRVSTNAQKKARREFEGDSTPIIQTVINITLDKDTPHEYWDRVLALIGEGKNNEQIETRISKETESRIKNEADLN